jgi:hypothetical protein
VRRRCPLRPVIPHGALLHQRIYTALATVPRRDIKYPVLVFGDHRVSVKDYFNIYKISLFNIYKITSINQGIAH